MTIQNNILSMSRQAVPVDAKWAFTTRRVRREHARDLNPDTIHAVSGDLLLCRVREIGQHKRIQLAEGRPSEIQAGDLVVVCVGDRYAPDQYEGVAEIDPRGADLLAAGGIAGRMLQAHERMAKPTKLEPLGLITDEADQILNIASYALPHRAVPQDIITIGVFGTSMNAGKTTAAVSLAYGLRQAGFRTVGIKATGTGAFGDYNAFLDAGVPALDFTDAGMATTYLQPIERIEEGFERLLGEAGRQGAQIVVVEIADGIMQPETAAIMRESRIKARMSTTLFAAGDALGAIGAAQFMTAHGMEPFAISGLLACSPLAMREVEQACHVRCLNRDQLRDPQSLIAALEGYLPSVQAVPGAA